MKQRVYAHICLGYQESRNIAIWLTKTRFAGTGGVSGGMAA